MKSGPTCDILKGTPAPGGAGLRPLLIIIALPAAAAVVSCSGDLNLGEYTFACETDNDCGAGYRCDKSAGCIKTVGGADGGGGLDAGKPDGGPHPGDAGGEDACDAGGMADGGTDAGHHDAGDAGGADTGHIDGGPGDAGSGDGGFIIRFSSVHDTAAGTCTGTGFTLKSVTGWTAGFRWSAGGYTLQSGEPYRQ